MSPEETIIQFHCESISMGFAEPSKYHQCSCSITMIASIFRAHICGFCLIVISFVVIFLGIVCISLLLQRLCFSILNYKLAKPSSFYWGDPDFLFFSITVLASRLCFLFMEQPWLGCRHYHIARWGNWRFLKEEIISLPYDAAIPLLDIYLKENKVYIYTHKLVDEYL